MKVVLQRVQNASVTIEGKTKGQIKEGFMLLVGITHEDTQEIIKKMIEKIITLRVFSDKDGKMNLSLQDINGEILSISQFTLYADCKKGRRPSFIQAAKPNFANDLYNYFNNELEKKGVVVRTGEFGADMKVELLNDGPVTIILDSKELF